MDWTSRISCVHIGQYYYYYYYETEKITRKASDVAAENLQ